MTIVNRLQKILDYSKLSTRGLAIKCGLKQQTLDKHLKGISDPSVGTLTSILNEFPEISAEWLMRGEGEMLKTAPAVDLEAENRLMRLVDTIALLQESLNEKQKTINTLSEKLRIAENKSKVL